MSFREPDMGAVSNVQQLREHRAMHWQANSEIVTRAKDANRNLTAAEAREYDEHESRMRELDKAIRTKERYASAADNRVERAPLTPDEEKREAAFNRYMRFGERSPELRTTYDAGLNESGFQASGSAGGYMVPQGFWNELTVAMKAFGGYGSYYRQVLTDTGNPMDWPTVNPTAVVGGIISEGVIDGFTDYTIGQGVLQAWTYTNQVILASVELVQDSAVDIQSFVAARIGEAIGRAEGAHSVSGSGSGQPLGLITALAAGSRYVNLSSATSTNVVGGTTVTELAGNVLGPVTLAKMIQGVDSAYWPGAAFYFSPNQFVAQQNLADGYGRPLYPSLQSDTPTLLGFPVRTVAESPALVASTTGGPVFGDLEIAMIRRRVDTAALQVLHERYADARQIGFYGYVRQDHRSNDLRAAITVHAAAS